MSNSAAARSDDPPPGPSDTPAAKFTELRALLVGPEQRQLHALQTRLEDPAAQARDVSRVLATAVARYASEVATERTVSSIPLTGEEMKGKIIGREGRNIRALEAACGVDLIIDETPETVIISTAVQVMTRPRPIATGRVG